ncbi:MAG: type II secretion system protein [Parcubacteria group bacterium]
MIQKRRKERGFTLIELLVVIAIIGVLSSVVLASLNSARGKGNDAKIKAQISSARGSAEIYYSNQSPPSYSGTGYNLCTALVSDVSGFGQYMQAANYPDSTVPGCTATAQAYVMWHTLPFVGGYWCVDAAGASKGLPTGTANPAGTVCP